MTDTLHNLATESFDKRADGLAAHAIGITSLMQLPRSNTTPELGAMQNSSRKKVDFSSIAKMPRVDLSILNVKKTGISLFTVCSLDISGYQVLQVDRTSCH